MDWFKSPHQDIVRKMEDKTLRNLFLIRLSLVLFFSVIMTYATQAQDKIAYVDSQRILTTYPAAKDARNKLDTENNTWGQELQKMQQEIKTIQNQLDQQSLLLSDAKRQEKADELQKLIEDARKYQNQIWGENGEFFRKQRELMQPVYVAINEAINRIGEEDGYDMIIDGSSGALLFAKDDYDITDQVIETLPEEQINQQAAPSGGVRR